MFHTKFPAKAFDAQGQHTGPGPWLDLLREANGVHHGFFGEPESVDAWWAGGSVEVYAHVACDSREDAQWLATAMVEEHGLPKAAVKVRSLRDRQATESFAAKPEDR